LIKFSGGLNLGMHYLSGAITYDPLAKPLDAVLASKIVWLDALIANMDRTAKNTNMLVWNKELWLIDHGASFYFHHSRPDIGTEGERAFPFIKDHVFLRWASELASIDAEFRSILTKEVIQEIVSLIPEDWLIDDPNFNSTADHRQAYARFLESRVNSSDIFIKEVENARKAII